MFTKAVIFLFLVKSAFCGFHHERLPEELLDIAQPMMDKCAKETGATIEQLQNIDMDNCPKHLKCYLTCILREANWIKPDGSAFDVSLIHEIYSFFEDIMGKAYRECLTVTAGPDPCDIGYNMNYCFYKTEPEKFYIF